MKFVSKGWGFEKWIVNKEKYCGKLLYFVKGKQCSWHYHKNKDETFYIQSGKVQVLWTDNLELAESVGGILETMGDPKKILDELHVLVLEKGDSFHVPPGRVHQILAMEDAELFEFSTFHEDSDSYRIIKGD